MTVTYERQWLDGDGRNTYQRKFIEFNSKLATLDLGPLAGQSQILDSPDGAVWSNLFTIDNAVVGIETQSNFVGMGLAVFQDNLWVSQFINVTNSNAKVLEWDGSSTTQHLKSGVAHNNKLSYSLLVWNSNLWLITDTTPFILNNQRVVYFYNGTTWTAIVDYDGTAYLNYGSNTTPQGGDKHRRSDNGPSTRQSTERFGRPPRYPVSVGRRADRSPRAPH